MGWNTAALFVQSSRQAVLDALAEGHELTNAELGFDEATLRRLAPGLAIAEIGAWTALWDPCGRIAVDAEGERLRRSLSRGRKSLAVLWASTVSQYGFRYYVDGDLVRAVLYEHGAIGDEEGDPIPEEDDIDVPSWGPDEDWCFTIVERLTGIGFSLQAQTRYRLVDPV